MKKEVLSLNVKGSGVIRLLAVPVIIAILTAVSAPKVFAQTDESKTARALADCKSIQSAIMAFKKDTGKWPMFSGGSFPCALQANGGNGAVIAVLASSTEYPAIASGLPGTNGWEMEAPVQMTALLYAKPSQATPVNSCYPEPANGGAPGWKGPYLKGVAADPWNRAYLVNAVDFEGSPDGVWVVSAGPNGIIETGTEMTALGGDDIGIKIK